METTIYNLNFWHTRNNYGAVLTAYSLQKILSSLGYCSELIDNRNMMIELTFRKLKFINKFANHYLKTSEKHYDKAITQLNNNSSIFISGSDQVFRPIYCLDKLEHYLLDFVKPESKKIAFSASFGVNKEQFLKENSDEIIEHMKNSLKSFDFVSVRENTGVEICHDIFGIDAEWIIDPVFMLEKDSWNELIGKTINKYSNKIVSYVLDTDENYKKAYKYLSKKYNKSIIETAKSNISVEDWLISIRDCDLFITDSFHGMCFAIIFNKPFICLANKDRGASRFVSICEMLGIDYHCIESITDVTQKDCIFKVDYNKVNQRIEEERQRGLTFLNKVLNAPITITQEKISTRMRYLERRVYELEKQNSLSYQLKNYLWEKWLIIYHCYLPNFVKKTIGFFWHRIKGFIKQ